MKDTEIIQEAQKRFDACKAYESLARTYFKQDYRFSNGDARNLYQWDKERTQQRDATQRPYLTINKTRQHNLQIVNDGKQNKPAIAIKPTGGDATYESAQIMQDLIRHIEYRSNATLAYDNASNFQVQAGWGYWRIVNEYVDDSSFEQELLIKTIADPLSVYIDPYAKEVDKSDMRFAFVFEDVAREEIEIKYPEFKDKVPSAPLGNNQLDWIGSNTVRVAEYYRLTEKKDTLVFNTTTGVSMYKSDIDPEIWSANGGIDQDPTIKTRRIMRKKIEWFFIIGDKIMEKATWPGKFIPIVKVTGEEFIIDGQYDCRGHTRALIDPQRMYNYMSSAAVEYSGVQSKTPWLVSFAAIEGYEQIWKAANVNNYAYLPYKSGLDQDGQPIPPPTRIEPPAPMPVSLAGMEVAAREMQMVSGQYDAAMGEKGNERSGIAIDKRQRRGDNATYHYVDNLAIAVALTGRILLDAIPHFYDTPRTIMIIGEDGETVRPLQINPQQEEALVEEEASDGEVVSRSLNPKVGMYEVQSHAGPAFSTRRQEAFEAFTLMMTQAPQLTAVIGDIMFRSADFPLANEAAKRLKNMVPRQALGLGPTEEEAALQQQLQQLTAINSELMDKLGVMQSELVRNSEKTAVDRENAITQRLKVLFDKETDIKEFRLGVAGILMDSAFGEAKIKSDQEKIKTVGTKG